MARDDRLKKVQEAGADFLDAARVRAEEFLRELARASGDTQGKAQEALDELVEGSRKGTESLVSSIRKEISAQLGLLGIATKDDLADLEARLAGRPGEKHAPTAKAATTPKKAAPKQPASKKRAAKPATAAKKTSAKKAAD